MSRSGYSDDYGSEWDLICWRGAVASAVRGKRGQAFLRETLAVLDGMGQKRLIRNDLTDGMGEVCAIGSVGLSRGVDMSELDPEDRDAVALAFGISPALAAEVMWMNDEWFGDNTTPEQRHGKMREWVKGLIREGSSGSS